MASKKGVIYTASGKKYIDEAIYSAKTLKKHNKSIHATLYTSDVGVKSRYFDSIINQPANKHPQKYKIENMVNSPYEKTLYLDSDTKINGSIAELFDFLLIYDMGFTNRVLCTWGKPVRFKDYIDKDCINGGFILFIKNEKTIQFLSDWSTKMNRNKDEDIKPGTPTGDQIPLNDLIFKEKLLEKLNINFVILPNKIYNARPWLWKQAKLDGEFKNIKILHDKGLKKSLLMRLVSKVKYIVGKIYASR